MRGRTAAGGDGRAGAEGLAPGAHRPDSQTHTENTLCGLCLQTGQAGPWGWSQAPSWGRTKGAERRGSWGRACDSCILVTLPESLMLYICVLYVIDMSTKTCVKRIHYQVKTPHRQEGTKD